MPPHAERNTPDHAHKSQDRSIRLPASSCTTTICRSPSRGVDGLRSHPRASRGRSMQDPASELPRIHLLRGWVNKVLSSKTQALYLPQILGVRAEDTVGNEQFAKRPYPIQTVRGAG